MRRLLFSVISFFCVVTAQSQTPSIANVEEFQPVLNNADALITRRPFNAASTGKKQFERIEGYRLGLNQGFQYTIADYPDPFWFGRGTAGGDFNRDGWQDIVFGSDHGVFIYKNTGGRFELQNINQFHIAKLMIYAVALVDMNNDGWLDLFVTSFNHGNFLVLNRDGKFDFSHAISVPNQNAILTISPSFADLDKDGLLDVVNGNIALGVVTGFYHMNGRRNNSMAFNQMLKFSDIGVESSSGETMATLVSDFNNDGITDLYFGNDFTVPDKVLLGTGKGYDTVIGNQFIPFTPFFSMGADTGDINNDLSLDMLITGTMYMAPFIGEREIDGVPVVEYSKFKGGKEICETIENQNDRKRCHRIRDTNYLQAMDASDNPSTVQCASIKNPIQKEICFTRVMWNLTSREVGLNDCKSNFAKYENLLAVCETLKLRGARFERRDFYEGIPQDDRNMLYAFDPTSKRFSLVTEFKHPGGWTWNAKIVDIDNDGWQDVISADGTIRKSGYGWSAWMKNIDGKRFEQKQFSEGFTSEFGLYSFSLIDLDNDGDLDVVANSAEGPVQVFRNQSKPSNHRVAIGLIDKINNRNAIGAKVYIYYANRQRAQIREIKASGGYMSFDPAIAYFGLGDVTTIDEIKVVWPDQVTKTYVGPFTSGYHYQIERLD